MDKEKSLMNGKVSFKALPDAFIVNVKLSSTMLTGLHAVDTNLAIAVERLLLVELFMRLRCKLSSAVYLW